MTELVKERPISSIEAAALLSVRNEGIYLVRVHVQVPVCFLFTNAFGRQLVERALWLSG